MSNQPSQGAVPRVGAAVGLPAGGPGAGRELNPELRRPHDNGQPIGLQAAVDPRDHYGVRERHVVNNMRIIGPAENRAFFDKYLAINLLLTGLMYENLNYPPFIGTWTDDLIVTMAYLGNCGRAMLYNGPRRLPTDLIYTVTIADMLGPQLSTSIFLDEVQARQTLVDSVKALVGSEDLATYSAADVAAYNELAAHPENPETAMHFRHLGNPVYGEFAVENIHNVQTAIRVLRFLAINGTRGFQLGGLGVIIHVIVSVVKGGNVTQDFITKIYNGVTADLESCPPLRYGVIDAFYRHFGNSINDVNIAQIFHRWTALIGEKCLRLNLTITQASGSGLTSYLVIGQAMRAYNDFDWGRIALLYPVEWQNYRTAVEAVGDNPFFGYRKDLGPVRSTKYKSLAYVAKQLLIMVGGQSSLRYYQGWATRVPDKEMVDNMITQYERDHGDVAANTPIPHALNMEVNALIADLLGHNRVFV